MELESPKRPQRRSKKAVTKEGFPIRLHISGSTIDILSPVPREQFIQEMVEAINKNGASPEWSGWYTLKTIKGKVVSIRVREIGAAEEL
tara:strand:+ start:7875 stop:8141 length:267 start_codon:yes stop_codon:yes gene_type:complete